MNREFSKESMQRIDFYKQHYHVLANIDLVPGERKYIGNRENRICRYCGKTPPLAKFQNVSHTFPQFIGNKSLISYDECDDCNAKFSNSIDVHLARYLGIETTIAKIPGKKGVPTYRVPGMQPRMEYSVPEKMLMANAHIDDGFFEIDENRQEVKINSYRQPYMRRSAYKCLTKMALAIMPDDELIQFRQTLDWVTSKEDKLVASALACFRSRSTLAVRAINAVLLKRVESEVSVPYMSFFITFYNFSFQIFPPLCAKDADLKKIQVCHFPNKIEKFCDVSYYIDDLTSKETVRGEKSVQNFSYKGEVIKTSLGPSEK